MNVLARDDKATRTNDERSEVTNNRTPGLVKEGMEGLKFHRSHTIPVTLNIEDSWPQHPSRMLPGD